MRRIGLGILAAVIVALLVASVAAAVPPGPVPANQVAKDKSPAIDDEGNVISPRESELTKIVFIRYAEGKGWGKGGNPNKGNGDDPTPTPTPEPQASTCYAFLSGAKPRWKVAEDYWVDNPALATATATAVATWEGATSGTIFGEQQTGAGAWGDYDGKNSITLYDYPTPGVLGVTALWFRGKTMYEYDIALDTDYFASDGSGSYDFNTVVLHEWGHAVGLADFYNEPCNDQVMFGELSTSDVKSVLQDGDIAGVRILYGP